MQINTSLIDCAYHITAMLVEVPQLSAQNQKIVSKPFRKLIEAYDSRSFHVLQIEQYKDSIVMATRELARANWKEALRLICNIKFVKNLAEFEDIQRVLTQRFKEAALVTFLSTSLENNKNFSLELLSKLFSLDEKQIIRVISKQILHKEIIGVKIDLKLKQVKIDEEAMKYKENDHLSLSLL